MYTVTRTPRNMSDTYTRVYNFKTLKTLKTAQLFMKMMVNPGFKNILKEEV